MAAFPPNPQYTPPVDGATKRFTAQWTDWFAKIEQYITLTGAYGGGVLPATAGGTGFGSYAIGDLLYAATTTTLARRVAVATGNALISGGVNTAPTWGKIGLTTHVSGVLPAANGGTGVANNAASTLTISGSFACTFTVTGVTGVTFPTSGTLATTAQLPVGANPSASIGTAAVNGTAVTFMRSDAVPAFDVTANRTFTGTNQFATLTVATIFRPPTDAGALQTATAIYAGTGAPNNANGADGDYYFRSDGDVATHIYFKVTGAWVGII